MIHPYPEADFCASNHPVFLGSRSDSRYFCRYPMRLCWGRYVPRESLWCATRTSRPLVEASLWRKTGTSELLNFPGAFFRILKVNVKVNAPNYSWKTVISRLPVLIWPLRVLAQSNEVSRMQTKWNPGWFGIFGSESLIWSRKFLNWLPGRNLPRGFSEYTY